MAQVIKNPPASAGDPGSILGWEDPLEKEMATLSSILAWEVPWREETGGLVWGVTKSQTRLGTQACRHSLLSPTCPVFSLQSLCDFCGVGVADSIWRGCHLRSMVLKWCFGSLYCLLLVDFTSQSRATCILHLKAQPLLLPSGSIQLYFSSSGPITKDYYSLG